MKPHKFKQILSFLGLIFLGTMHASPVLASGAPEKAAVEPNIKISAVALPIFVDRRVTNYIFVSIKIHLTPKANIDAMRAKEPYFRDALMKSAYKTSYGQKDSDDKLDEKLFKTQINTLFTGIAGPGMIQSIEIVEQKAKTQRRR